MYYYGLPARGFRLVLDLGGAEVNTVVLIKPQIHMDINKHS